MIRKILCLSLLFVSLHSLKADYKSLIKRVGGQERYPAASYLTIFDSTYSDVQETGLTYVNRKYLVKILNYKGARKWNVIKLDYDPLSAHIEFKKIKVYRANGEVEEIATNMISDYTAPARAIYWGARRLMAEVGRLDPGDAIEVHTYKKGYTYALLASDDEEKYIPPMRGHYYDIVEFWDKEPLLQKTYIAKVPASKEIQYKFYNGKPLVKESVEDGKKLFSFTQYNFIPKRRESSMVAWSDVMPKLLISTSPDWEAKSLWFHKVNEDYGSFESFPELDAKVNEIIGQETDKWEQISLLTHWVADNMRYSGLTMGEGEGFTLHNAKMNFKDRCGVCKDKASLLIAMLRSAGFESYPAMTMAGSRIDSIPADQFNHCVTAVKVDGKYHMLDPTWVPLVRELWSSAEQQQNYLMGVPEGAGLMETPVSAPENHYFKMNGITYLKEDGSVKGEIKLKAEGQTDASVRGIFTRNRMKDWEYNIRKEFQQISPNIHIDSVWYSDPYAYQQGPIEIHVFYQIPQYAQVLENAILFKSVLSQPFMLRGQSHLYMNTSAPTKKYGFKDRCSRLVEINEEIHLPKGYEIAYKPDAKEGDANEIKYDLQYETADSKLKLIEKLSFPKRVYEAKDWPAFRNAVNAQKDFGKQELVLKKIKNQ